MSDELEMLNPAYEQGLSVPDEQLRQVWADLDIACAMFYGDCDEPTTKAAFDRLRPQSAYPAILPCSLAEFPALGNDICGLQRRSDPASGVVEANRS